MSSWGGSLTAALPRTDARVGKWLDTRLARHSGGSNTGRAGVFAGCVGSRVRVLRWRTGEPIQGMGQGGGI
jgi:hypothetical protein